MELLLKREPSGVSSTLGELSVNGSIECFSLEDVVRIDDAATQADEGAKVFGKTAIPAGRYMVTVDFSNRFQELMPRLLNVQGFTGIRIHPGNTDADTDGCILVGQARAAGQIRQSRPAYKRLLGRIEAALQADEEVWITIADAVAEPEHT